MYSRVSLDELEARSIEGLDPVLKAVGYELRPDEMRPSVWEFDEGDANNRHYQERQEELYVVLSGRFRVDVDDETFEIETDDYVVVSPEAERQLTALEPSQLLVVGAPNVSDDAVVVE